MAQATAKIAASAVPKNTAREKWQNATVTRQDLKKQLLTMCARPSFCMYCYESRGTDVDHFTPIIHDPLQTFDWDNHILACGFCNQQAKKETFPLDAAGHPLLLDPSVADFADHMTMASTGEFIDLTPQGRETIDVLGLNARSELVDARHRSWRGVLRVFREAATAQRPLDADDVEDLRFLPVVDAFHHFAHDIRTGRLAAKAVEPALARYALQSLPAIQAIFPRCNL
ncbi:TIGR02646 family protein [Actinoplanes derwentensis]|uniref:TIGR02646 family protein n=2 Tax=Actinoplanes derwentensis TaxID=113562 RepID=A0A1H1TLF0_9ACTN|nr:TIGR02646 family protein [Actinoplanes derwentensis]